MVIALPICNKDGRIDYSDISAEEVPISPSFFALQLISVH